MLVKRKRERINPWKRVSTCPFEYCWGVDRGARDVRHCTKTYALEGLDVGGCNVNVVAKTVVVEAFRARVLGGGATCGEGEARNVKPMNETGCPESVVARAVEERNPSGFSGGRMDARRALGTGEKSQHGSASGRRAAECAVKE